MRASMLRAPWPRASSCPPVSTRARRIRPSDSTSSPATTRTRRARRRRGSRDASRTPTSGRAIRGRWPVTWSRARRPAASATMSAAASRTPRAPPGRMPSSRRGDLGLGRDRRHAFPPPRDPGLVARAQIPGRHGRLSHRRSRRARPGLRHHEHPQQPGPPREGRAARIGRHEQGAPVLIAERTDEQTGSPSSRGCIAPSKSPCGSGELFDYSRRRCSRRVASRCLQNGESSCVLAVMVPPMADSRYRPP